MDEDQKSADVSGGSAGNPSGSGGGSGSGGLCVTRPTPVPVGGATAALISELANQVSRLSNMALEVEKLKAENANLQQNLSELNQVYDQKSSDERNVYAYKHQQLEARLKVAEDWRSDQETKRRVCAEVEWKAGQDARAAAEASWKYEQQVKSDAIIQQMLAHNEEFRQTRERNAILEQRMAMQEASTQNTMANLQHQLDGRPAIQQESSPRRGQEMLRARLDAQEAANKVQGERNQVLEAKVAQLEGLLHVDAHTARHEAEHRVWTTVHRTVADAANHADAARQLLEQSQRQLSSSSATPTNGSQPTSTASLGDEPRTNSPTNSQSLESRSDLTPSGGVDSNEVRGDWEGRRDY